MNIHEGKDFCVSDKYQNLARQPINSFPGVSAWAAIQLSMIFINFLLL